MAGDHFYDGFILEKNKDDAKQVIDELLHRLNNEETITVEEVGAALSTYSPA